MYNYQLVAAFVDCATLKSPTADTTSTRLGNYGSLDGCKNGLAVQQDTIYISFTPTIPGTHSFDKITILTRDQDKVLRTLIYEFDYFVTE